MNHSSNKVVDEFCTILFKSLSLPVLCKLFRITRNEDGASHCDLISFMIKTLLDAGEHNVKSGVIEFVA